MLGNQIIRLIVQCDLSAAVQIENQWLGKEVSHLDTEKNQRVVQISAPMLVIKILQEKSLIKLNFEFLTCTGK